MNRTALVTGATDGTGYAIAERFAKDGWNVAITSRELARAQAAASALKEQYGVETFAYGLEVMNEDQISGMFAELSAGGSPVDALVCNAANLGNAMPDLFEIDFDMWFNVIQTNIGWNFMFARNAARYMKEKGKGSIVFIGSVTGIRALKGKSAYVASKSGLHGLSRALAIDLAQYGIRVNTVVAGTIKTKRYMANPEMYNSPHCMIPMREQGAADFIDIAEAAYFLSSDAAKFVTGSELRVDGGQAAQLCYEKELTNPYTFGKK